MGEAPVPRSFPDVAYPVASTDLAILPQKADTKGREVDGLHQVQCIAEQANTLARFEPAKEHKFRRPLHFAAWAHEVDGRLGRDDILLHVTRGGQAPAPALHPAEHVLT